jgi:thiol-disulfide isomerase/thioredoxin
VTLVVFWAGTCGACMDEVPHERELLKQYAGKSFAIVGVNSDVDLPLKQQPVPYEVLIPVSHGLAPNEFDRFTIEIEDDPILSVGSGQIYQADLEIVMNGESKTIRKENLLFAVTYFTEGFPTESELTELIEAQKSVDDKVNPAAVRQAMRTIRTRILDVSKLLGTFSPSLEQLIDTAKKSDVR